MIEKVLAGQNQIIMNDDIVKELGEMKIISPRGRRARSTSISSHRLVTPPSKKVPFTVSPRVISPKVQFEAGTIPKKRPPSNHTASTVDITNNSPRSRASKQDFRVPNVLEFAFQDDDESSLEETPFRCPSFAEINAHENGDTESVGSVGRILVKSPRGVYKKMGGRWDSNLLEDSMPDLVSFCHGSFTSGEGLASVVADDDSVSSLECSIMISPHNSIHHGSTLLQGSFENNQEASSECDNVLEPLARIQPDDKHQEVRWGGSVHRSSSTLPVLSPRVRGRKEANGAESYHL